MRWDRRRLTLVTRVREIGQPASRSHPSYKDSFSPGSHSWIPLGSQAGIP